MFVRLLALFVIVPIVEVYLLFKLNDFTGSPVVTISLILITGFIGAWLAKQQGLQTLARIQQALSEGRMPATELMDGGMILFAAALLLTPGMMTDAFGFSLLMPPCRKIYRTLLKRNFPVSSMNVHVATSRTQTQTRHDELDDDPSIVEGTATPHSDDN